MSDTLKPCPFCGCAQLKISPNVHTGYLRVQCESCWATSVTSNRRETVIAAWDRRHPQPEVEALVKALEQIKRMQYEGRYTVSEATAWPAFQDINRRICRLYEIARSALATYRGET